MGESCLVVVGSRLAGRYVTGRCRKINFALKSTRNGGREGRIGGREVELTAPSSALRYRAFQTIQPCL